MAGVTAVAERAAAGLGAAGWVTVVVERAAAGSGAAGWAGVVTGLARREVTGGAVAMVVKEAPAAGTVGPACLARTAGSWEVAASAVVVRGTVEGARVVVARATVVAARAMVVVATATVVAATVTVAVATVAAERVEGARAAAEKVEGERVAEDLEAAGWARVAAERQHHQFDYGIVIIIISFC